VKCLTYMEEEWILCSPIMNVKLHKPLLPTGKNRYAIGCIIIFITLDELFSGSHTLLKQGYSPMAVRFFILQAHYRGTLDFSNEALLAAEKGFMRLIQAPDNLAKIIPSSESTVNIADIKNACHDAMNDDMNTPVAIASLFDTVKMINLLREGKEKITAEDLSDLSSFMHTFITDVLGLSKQESGPDTEKTAQLMDTILKIRQEAKERKDFQVSDRIREELQKIGIEIRDVKDGTEWRWG